MPLNNNPFIITPSTDIDIPKDLTTEKEIGSYLWDVLALESKFQEACERSGKDILPVVIESNDSEILQLPWELLHHEKYGFLATNPQFTLSRKIPNVPAQTTTPKKEPLRILFFSTLPDDLSTRGRLAVENEQIAILEALTPFRKEGWVELDIPNDGRFESLKHHIDKFKPHLVFLSGHSSYDKGKGSFLFEDKRGFSTHIDEEELSTAFIGSTVESVVLSSCQSAQADDTRLNSGLARALAFKGINNVIGMSQSIYDKAGATFAEHFVKALASQKSIAEALQKGRAEIAQLEGVVSTHWHLPLLLSQDIHTPLLEWDFTPTPPKKEVTLKKLNQITFDPLFIGRRKEFRDFYNRLYDDKLKRLLIFGEGGMGKTAMVAQFALKLRHEGYTVFDYSLKHGSDFEDFLLDMELDLSEENAKRYEKIKERCRDEHCKAKRLVRLLVDEHKKVTFIFDNLEDIQNNDTKELEDKTLKAWVEALSETDDVVMLLTSRWKLPEFEDSECIQLGKPLKVDFLHYLSFSDMDFSEKSKIDRVYDTLGGNFRGTKLFVKATEGMSLKDETAFLEKLSTVEEAMQIDMAIEQILSTRTEDEIELLHRLTVYPLPVIRGGVIKILEDLSIEALDTLVSFSLVEESDNHEYGKKEYQVSALVAGHIAGNIKLQEKTAVLASEFQLYMFLLERKTLSQALITHEALVKMGQVEKLETWLFNVDNKEDVALRGLVLGNLATQHHSVANYGKALKYMEASLKIQQEIGDRAGEGVTLNNISQIYNARGDYDTALTYLEASLKIRQEIGDRAGEGTTLNNISQIYDARGDYDTTLTYLEASLRIAKEIGDRVVEGATLNNIATANHRKGDYDKALTYLEASLKIRQEIGDRAGEGTTLNNISAIYDQRGDYDTALTYLEDSLKIAKEIGDKSNEGGLLNNISQIYDARGDYDTALTYLEASLKIRQEIEDNAGLCSTLFNMGHIYLENDKIQEAVERWVAVYILAKKLGLAQALDALESLAGQLGLDNGLEGWEQLAQQFETKGD